VIVSAVGVIVLTRIIGPEAYGLYAAAFGIYIYLFIVFQWGVNTYLIRREEEPLPQDYNQAFSLLLLLSLAGTGAAILLALPLLERWVNLEGFGPVATAMFAVLPVQLLGLVPMARLERALDYRRIALIELTGLIIFYLVALPLAYQGLGYWAPIVGKWVEQLLISSLLYWMSSYRPQLYWENARVRSMVGYGLGYSSSIWIWQLRSLVNPLVVGRYLGAEMVGYVALAIRLVEQLSFAKLVAYRLSIAALARLQGDRARMVKAVTEAMGLQVMALGPFLAGFGMLAPWIIPLLFGYSWLSVLEVYPFIALSYLSNAVFALHSSTLYVLGRNWRVAIFHLVHMVLFGGSALLLVPRLGLEGYGWAEVVALPSYILVHWFIVYVGKPGYVRAGIWFTASTIPLFSWQLGAWTIISIFIPLLWPATRRDLLEIIRVVLQRRTYGHHSSDSELQQR